MLSRCNVIVAALGAFHGLNNSFLAPVLDLMENNINDFSET